MSTATLMPICHDLQACFENDGRLLPEPGASLLSVDRIQKIS
ncbi:hypothetical protein EaACW_1991 [Erwinia amylovora ACW56400]|uniref:Uncharacterized protein n=3 Tax=Erwinia amylovora TaxID=552 RepID=A0A831A2W8_ERWAM|nr:hypothetical protein EaACW_1991 [Erwinia amylovora ACW56400]CBA20930.1 hypothetical protein predicted by Glimmer/Critica [Erwinia amylovora CFBP1430]CBX80854.1 hypothetical protein predicted by Glimmer/Critica [Erwinia amylovora ATCC BAA-2158]CCO78838.1 hypothetical protein BN432_2041 [Erwinia amylovora Ea356]CCO82636.1 hypothetical protein BN433_2066 [Erwinia amylovora Ea266]CCO86417.1 hypothetical protein BN434_2030 [Erwinia amylovora CFBP 2585]CCO90203.1 hypothetical protein BN435_2033 